MVAPKCTIDAITSIAALAAIRPAMSVSVGRSWEGVSCPGVVAGDAGWDMRSLSRPRVMASSGGVRGGSRCAQRKGPAHGRPFRSKSLSSRLTRAGKRCKYREVVWSGPRPSAEDSWPSTRVPPSCDGGLVAGALELASPTAQALPDGSRHLGDPSDVWALLPSQDDLSELGRQAHDSICYTACRPH